MAWSADFLTALEGRQQALAFYVERLAVTAAPGTAYRLSSHDGLGEDEVRLGRVEVQGCRLDPRGWHTTFGAAVFEVLGGDSAATSGLGWLQAMTRGTFVAIYAGFEGWDEADFEQIFLGQIRNVSGVRPSWRVECIDIFTAFRTRVTRANNNLHLFSSLSTTTVSTNFTFGVDTALEVGSTSGFEKTTGMSGLLYVTPSGGDPYYLSYTGTAAGPTRFTGVGTTAELGTSGANLAPGDTVQEAAWVYGHPVNVLRALLCSTGAGTNGAYDLAPATWGLGINDGFLDHDDIDDTETLVQPSSGSWEFHAYALAKTEDAWAWMAERMAEVGLFFAMRQGLLTIRPALDTQTAGAVLAIDDDDIEAITAYTAWDEGHAPEYQLVRVQASSGVGTDSTNSDAATMPSGGLAIVDVSPYVFSNASAVEAELLDRVQEHLLGVPESITVRCAGLRLAQLCPGDVVEFSSTRTDSRRAGSAGWSSEPALVVEVTPDWMGGTVTLGLLIYPPDQDVFS